MVRGTTNTSSTKNTSDCASGQCHENYKQEVRLYRQMVGKTTQQLSKMCSI